MTPRAAAVAAGEKHYETGKPCKNGHVAKRATLTGTCAECTRLAAQSWVAARPGKAAAYAAAYRDRNREEVREKDRIAQATRRAADPEGVRAKRAAQYAEKVGTDYRAGGRLPLALVRARTAEVTQGLYEYVRNYTGQEHPATFRCTEHLLEFAARPHNVLRGALSCPQCGGTKTSRAEREIADFVRSLGVEVQQQVRTVIAPKEIDVWVPEHKLGIEYHGLFWHVDSNVDDVHRKKWEAAAAAGVRLLQVFEDEWRDRQPIVRARIAAMLGFGERRHARKLELRALAWRDAATFLADTHLQGRGTAGTANYGLFDADTLVAVATFGRARTGAMTKAKGEGAWEVLRYASVGRVVGGFGRLLARFEAEHLPRSLSSYCDLRFGDGRLYTATGFMMQRISEPDYWWVPPPFVRRVSRYEVQKHKMEKHPELGAFYAPGKTEKQICEEAGWERISGVGNQRWLKAYAQV